VSGFHDARLELPTAIGAVGGPERMTDVVQLASGREQRIARWSGSRRRWELGGGVMRMDEAHELAAFFEARRGRAFGFRFRDPLDWKSCAPSGVVSAGDQVIGIGDGETAAFQLVKRYASGGVHWDRVVRRPVVESVRVAVDGVETAAFAVDVATGVVTLEDAPGEGAEVRAGFEYDVGVRFDVDRLETVVEGGGAVRLGPLSLVELIE
jgi:uncharacterized protein (TIGR02217 family)